MKACAILLAAGRASRMGAVKALLPLPLLSGGAPCSALEGLVRCYRGAGVEDILLVSGFHAAEVEAAARGLGLAVVRNPRPEEGMFSSACAGLRAVPEDCAVCFVHPVDVPLVRSLTLAALLDAAASESQHGSSSVLIPTYEGKEGHPPLLPSVYREHILAHERQGGEGGLRSALAGLPRRYVPVADSFILEDMDRPEDYARLRTLAALREALWPAEAWNLLRLCRIPERGLRHACAVGAVAAALAQVLRESRAERGWAGTGPDPELARAGGLLHDVCKGLPEHEKAGGRFLAELGLPVAAAMVADHRDLSVPDAAPLTERELVYLADKYCHGREFVPLELRFGQKLDLYAADPAACAAIRGRLGRAQALEARLAREMGRPPADIARQALEALLKAKGGEPEAEPNSSRGDT